MIGVLTPERISPDCPFKTNQRLVKILILTPRCDAHRGALLRGRKHTTQLDSAVGSTLRSLTPRWDAHRGVC